MRQCSGKESTCQRRRHQTRGPDPRGRTVPWRRKWQPAPEFLPGESHGQRSLAGYSPWDHRKLHVTERLGTAHTVWLWLLYPSVPALKSRLDCVALGFLTITSK